MEKTFLILIAIISSATMALTMISCNTTKVDNSTIAELNLNRYLGKWYEIARFDHRFERNMQQCTATYTLQDDGTIKVINKGKKNGEWKESEGKAKTTNEPGRLRVSFFGPFYSDYRILMLAHDYSYALVGGNSDSYLWILSRTPKLEKNTKERIIYEAQLRGYDTSNLIWVEQSDNNM